MAARTEPTDEERPGNDPSDDIEPPDRETLPSWIRRWLRSRHRYGGIEYWLRFRGFSIVVGFGLLYLVNVLAVGGRTAYDLTVQIVSPWDTPYPWLTLPLSVAGWLVVTGFAGAVAGYVVTDVADNRNIERLRGKPRTGRIGAIPLLAFLQYNRHDFDVPDYFGIRFALRHRGDWPMAQDHWELVVERFLHLGHAGGPKQVMLAAVQEAAYVLDGMSGRCPVCGGPATKGDDDGAR